MVAFSSFGEGGLLTVGLNIHKEKGQQHRKSQEANECKDDLLPLSHCDRDRGEGHTTSTGS